MDIGEGIKLFNDGCYFEAHDFFEELWMDDRTEKKDFLQGLVQISVGLFHLSSSNYNGALNQLSKGLKKLESFPNSFENIGLFQFRQDINFLIEQITLFYFKKNSNFDIVKITFIEQNTNQT